MIGLELLMAVAMTTFGVFVASRISKMESFQVVMQMLLMPMLFLSGALFPLNGLPSWLAFITRLNPLTYAIAPFRQVIFDAQNMSAVAKAHFSTSVTWFGWPLPMWLELVDRRVFRCNVLRACGARSFKDGVRIRLVITVGMLSVQAS